MQIANDQRGYTLISLLAFIAVTTIAMASIAHTWNYMVTLDREEELKFRGEQYTTAILLYKKKFNRLPFRIDDLMKYKVIRKLYKDPITGYDFELIVQSPEGNKRESQLTQSQRQGLRSDTPGMSTMGIIGVVSTSPKVALRPWKEKEKYNEWEFIADEQQQNNSGQSQSTGDDTDER